MASKTPLPLPPRARELLLSLTEHDFVGASELRAQIDTLTAHPGCECGCATLRLVADRDKTPPAPAECPTAHNGYPRDADGDAMWGVIVFLKEGYLSSLEIYWMGEPRALLPEAILVKWEHEPDD